MASIRLYPPSVKRSESMTFMQALATQRWDDHRFYHHSRINQSLHLVSALAFIGAYALLFVNTLAAVMLGWLVAMPSRQAGHFFFEPKGYDDPNQVTHEYKEEVKVGYNLRRKVILMSVWALIVRTVHLFFLYDVQTGLVWCTKILTDPFHDVALYRKSPIHLFRGELYDPILTGENGHQAPHAGSAA